jgi:anthranilate synthase/aminodeoxychorismate synthase-like glutamine amidotransferase
MVLVIDNYDSFVHNLARYVHELGFETEVRRTDALSLAEIAELQPSHILISPGPCTPNEAGISLALIERFSRSIPILGICLGHQAIGQAYGAKVVRAKQPMHGKASAILHEQEDIFAEIDSPVQVGRYHSLIVSEEGFPAELQVLARCERGEIMALRHRQFPVYGVQFHPESILSDQGHQLLMNFLAYQ